MRTIYFIIVLNCTCPLWGQVATEIDRDSTEQWWRRWTNPDFSCTGNYGVNFRSYSAINGPERQTPLTSTLFLNTTFNINQVFIPVNLLVNNLDEINHPFHRGYWDGFLSNQRQRLSRLGFSPHYKWARVHVGHRYMHLSDFTLSNHNFLGGGVELNPGKFRFAAMAGRLAKAEPIDLALDRPNLPIYERVGWATKIGYGTAQEYIDLAIFGAKDDPNSLTITGDDNLVLPAENLVFSLRGEKQLLKGLRTNFEIARSAHTRNRTDEILLNRRSTLFNNGVFRERLSTVQGNAANAQIRYSLKKVQVGLQYQRIDPNFKTFGAYFFNDDLENYTIQLSGYGIGGFGFNGSLGVQRNNLDGSREATYRRIIGSFNASYQIKTWVFGVNYSNFQSEINYFLNPEADSLRVIIVTADASLNISKSIIQKGGTVHSLRFMGGRQGVNQNIATPTGDPATDMYYANLGYNLRLSNQWTGSLVLDYNRNSLSGTLQSRYGAGGRIGKLFWNRKLDLSLGSQMYIGSSKDTQRNTRQLNHTFRGVWRIHPLHQIQLQMNWIDTQNNRIASDSGFSELIGTIGYTGRFAYQPGKKSIPKG